MISPGKGRRIHTEEIVYSSMESIHNEIKGSVLWVLYEIHSTSSESENLLCVFKVCLYELILLPFRSVSLNVLVAHANSTVVRLSPWQSLFQPIRLNNVCVFKIHRERGFSASG